MSNFYDRLQALSDKICEDFSDEGNEGCSSVSVFRNGGGLDANLPWVYVRFGFSGPLSLYSLKAIEQQFERFCGSEGAYLQSIHMSSGKSGFMVKVVYHPRPKY